MKVELWETNVDNEYYITPEGKSPNQTGSWRYAGQRDLDDMKREFCEPVYVENFDKAKIIEDLQEPDLGYSVWNKPERKSLT